MKSKATQQLQSTGKLAGVTFVLTGTLPTLSREEVSRLITEHGGRVTGQRIEENNVSFGR